MLSTGAKAKIFAGNQEIAWLYSRGKFWESILQDMFGELRQVAT
jgi:hypothetical protein